MLADDFSFPVVETSLSHHFSVDPNSFWCVSPGRRRSGGWSCCSPREGEGEEEEEEEKEEKEKMDMLWEDFNEELKRVYSNKEGVGGERERELCCVHQPLEISRRTNGGDGGGSGSGGGVVSHRRQSVVVVGLKVLKKMFLLHNSARIFIRRRKPDRCYLNR